MLACRPMLSLAAALMAGILAARFHVEIRGWIPFLGLLLAGCVAAFLLGPKRADQPVPGLPEKYRPYVFPAHGFLSTRGYNRFILVAGLACFLLGILRQEAWRRDMTPSRLPEKTWFSATMLARAPIHEHPGATGGWRIPVDIVAVDGRPIRKLPVRLSGPPGPSFRRGDMIWARVRLAPARPPAHPGAFDFRFWLEKNRLLASLYVVESQAAPSGSPRYRVTPLDDVPLRSAVGRALDAARGWAISRTLRHGGSEGPVLAAMLYGYRKDMGDGLRDAFRRVGIGHLLAISGLHVGMIVGLLWWLGGWIGWRIRVRAVFCLVLAIAYLGLSGGQVAATRATVMAVLYLGGIAWGRRSDMLNSLGAAAFLIALASPTAPLDVGFQLSFTAVIFIHLALGRRGSEDGMRPVRRRAATGARARVFREVRSLTRLSVATWVGLLPIIALVFNQLNLAGLPVNIVAIPLMVAVLAGGLLLPFGGWLPGAAWLVTLPSRLLSAIAVWSDTLPWSSIPVHAPGLGWMAAFYLCILLYAMRGMLGGTSRRWWDRLLLTGAALSLAGVLAGMMLSRPPPGAGRIAILPGWPGVIVAESPEGDIAILGNLRRGGLNEAAWLQHLRRAGGVAVVSTGRAEQDALAGLGYHNPIRSFVRLHGGGKARERSPGWREVPGAPGVEYAIGRDGRGRLVWLAARTGGQSLCLLSRMEGPALADLFDSPLPGLDARLLRVSLSGDTAMPPIPGTAGQALVYGARGRDLPDRCFAGEGYGVVMLEETVSAYDGEGWVSP